MRVLKVVKYGYARVSTSGQDLEVQLRELENEKCDEIIYEKVSGAEKNRKELNMLLEKIGEGDMLVVTKLDRLARTVREGIDIIEKLFKKSAAVRIIQIGTIENTYMGRFFLNTLLNVAEMERNIILERTAQGKALAKKNPDFREGRPPKYTRKQINHALELLKNASYKEVSEITGISKSTLQRAKRERAFQESD